MPRHDVLQGQISSAKRILEFLENEAPRDWAGELMQPYKKWVQQLRIDVQRGEAWSRNVPNDYKTGVNP